MTSSIRSHAVAVRYCTAVIKGDVDTFKYYDNDDRVFKTVIPAFFGRVNRAQPSLELLNERIFAPLFQQKGISKKAADSVARAASLAERRGNILHLVSNIKSRMPDGLTDDDVRTLEDQLTAWPDVDAMDVDQPCVEVNTQEAEPDDCVKRPRLTGDADLQAIIDQQKAALEQAMANQQFMNEQLVASALKQQEYQQAAAASEAAKVEMLKLVNVQLGSVCHSIIETHGEFEQQSGQALGSLNEASEAMGQVLGLAEQATAALFTHADRPGPSQPKPRKKDPRLGADYRKARSTVWTKNMNIKVVKLEAQNYKANVAMRKATTELSAVVKAERLMEARGDFDCDAHVQKLMETSSSADWDDTDDDADDEFLIETVRRLDAISLTKK